MNTTRLFAALSLAALATLGTAQAQTAASAPSAQQRDIRQETRIHNGLQSGQLSTREAAVLQRQQAHVDQLQARALKDGQVTQGEEKRIDHAQDHASHSIAAARHNSVTGNPDSASSQRLQHAVQRDINQEKRIQQGMNSGELTAQETARLERSQAQDGRRQFRAGRDGHVGAHEARVEQRAQNRDSRRIWRQKHDAGKQAG